MVIELEHPIFGFERSNIELRTLFDPSLLISIECETQKHSLSFEGLKKYQGHKFLPITFFGEFSSSSGFASPVNAMALQKFCSKALDIILMCIVLPRYVCGAEISVPKKVGAFTFRNMSLIFRGGFQYFYMNA